MATPAPEPILRAALDVLHVAAYTSRNWTLEELVSRQQLNDLWEALHPIPHLLAHWRPGAEWELVMYLDEYDRKWSDLRLRERYERHLRAKGQAEPGAAADPAS